MITSILYQSTPDYNATGFPKVRYHRTTLVGLIAHNDRLKGVNWNKVDWREWTETKLINAAGVIAGALAATNTLMIKH